MLRIGQILSASTVARRGITAGSGLGVYEMRLFMIRPMDRAMRIYPQVQATVFVDEDDPTIS